MFSGRRSASAAGCPEKSPLQPYQRPLIPEEFFLRFVFLRRRDGAGHRWQTGSRGAHRKGRRLRIHPVRRAYHADPSVSGGINRRPFRYPPRAGRRLHGRGLGEDDPETGCGDGDGGSRLHQRALRNRQRPPLQCTGDPDRGVRRPGKRGEARPPGHEPASRRRAHGEEGLGLYDGGKNPRVHRPGFPDRFGGTPRARLPGAPLRRAECENRSREGPEIQKPGGFPSDGSGSRKRDPEPARRGAIAGGHCRQRRLVCRRRRSAPRIRRGDGHSGFHRELRPGHPPRHAPPLLRVLAGDPTGRRLFRARKRRPGPLFGESPQPFLHLRRHLPEGREIHPGGHRAGRDRPEPQRRPRRCRGRADTADGAEPARRDEGERRSTL